MRYIFNSFRFLALNGKIFCMYLKSVVWWEYLPDPVPLTGLCYTILVPLKNKHSDGIVFFIPFLNEMVI